MRTSKNRVLSLTLAVIVTIVGGLTVGTAIRANADVSSNWPHQCYYNCAGCGGNCLGPAYICCCQDGTGNCDEETQ